MVWKVRHSSVLYLGCRVRLRSSWKPCANWHFSPYLAGATLLEGSAQLSFVARRIDLGAAAPLLLLLQVQEVLAALPILAERAVPEFVLLVQEGGAAAPRRLLEGALEGQAAGNLGEQLPGLGAGWVSACRLLAECRRRKPGVKPELGAVATGVPTAFLSSMLFRLRLARDFSVLHNKSIL